MIPYRLGGLGSRCGRRHPRLSKSSTSVFFATPGRAHPVGRKGRGGVGMMEWTEEFRQMNGMNGIVLSDKN